MTSSSGARELVPCQFDDIAAAVPSVQRANLHPEDEVCFIDQHSAVTEAVVAIDSEVMKLRPKLENLILTSHILGLSNRLEARPITDALEDLMKANNTLSCSLHDYSLEVKSVIDGTSPRVFHGPEYKLYQTTKAHKTPYDYTQHEATTARRIDPCPPATHDPRLDESLDAFEDSRGYLRLRRRGDGACNNTPVTSSSEVADSGDSNDEQTDPDELSLRSRKRGKKAWEPDSLDF
ncbi:uncharacterized protein LOC144443571 [Glandiceps talaboti]